MFDFLFRRRSKPVGAADYSSPETWPSLCPGLTSRQIERAARSLAVLKKRHVPVYWGPLTVADDERVKLQTPSEVARRLLILWAVDLRAEGRPKSEVIRLIDEMDLWSAVSPKERAFLENESPDPQECQQLVWGLESIWVLLWALQWVEEMDWPADMCDVKRMAQIVSPRKRDPTFITSGKLRPTAQILDTADLILRIHWAIRDAILHHGRMIPPTLDWSKDEKRIPVTMSAAVGIVEQRHKALNWLISFCDPQDWDHVDTPT
jgi:uncharacterized protein DUF4272